MNMFFVQFSPLSCYLVPLTPKDFLIILLLNTFSTRSSVNAILYRTQFIINVAEPLTAEGFRSERDIGQSLRDSLISLDLTGETIFAVTKQITH
jgi:hypothetical protein